MSGNIHTASGIRSGYFFRYRKVLKVLLKYGFEDIVAHMPFASWVKGARFLVPKRNGKSVLSFSRYERIRMVCEELGTTFIKLAQLASNRPDVLPQELLNQLQKFHDQALGVPQEIIKKTLEEEYQRPLEDFFEYVDFEPLASASIAQVHRARTIGGREVVLKVQRPNLDKLVKADISIMKTLAGVLESHISNLGAFQPMELVLMFEESILKELHFKEEANNIRRFQANFQGNENIYVPDVFPEYSTDKILCLEYIEGIKATDLEAIHKAELDPKVLVLRGIGLYFEQVFDYGFFHADPHPGNIFVLKDGRICFIDFGMMGSISEEDKETLAVLMLAIAERDAKGLRKILMSEFTKGDMPPDEKA
ncbi:MAG: AarF/ABC1/UbiB kinase family protein, partial [Bacteroidetes bacterium]|nr:AarF/ABC1/UbiB kinase family protein [Bacteroidota bacterium]